MKVVLVNSNRVKPPLSPVGLLYLSAYLKSKGIVVKIVDLCMERDIPSALSAIADNRPGLIGISIRNIDSTQMRLSRYFLPETLQIIRKLKSRLPGAPLVLGGAGFSMEPLEIMKSAGAGYGVVGEGEIALHDLIRGIEGGKDIRSIPGLIYRTRGGEYMSNPPDNSPETFLSALPFQDIGSVDYRAYYNLGGMASLQTKRGCALKCAYCTYPLIEGRFYRLLDPKRVVDEMDFLVSRGFTYFHFTDSVFNVPRKHAMEVCREIIRRRLPVKWHTYMSPFGFDAELADLLAEAGNDGILFGVDSCSERMLKELGKNFRKADIERAAAECSRRGMEFSLNILFGAPGETMDTVDETLAALDEMRPTAAFLTQGIRVYRGTPVHRRLVDEGKLDASRSLLEPYYYLSEQLPADFCRRIRDYTLARDFVFSDANDESPSTNEDVMQLYKENFRGPCWRVLRELAKVRADHNLP